VNKSDIGWHVPQDRPMQTVNYRQFADGGKYPFDDAMNGKTGNLRSDDGLFRTF
jgi:hypothetical protein